MIKKQKTKCDIDASIARELDVPIVSVERITSQLFKEIETAVAEYGRIEIRNFGVLRVINIPARIDRNPKTGETFQSHDRKSVRFTAGKRFKKSVSQDVD